MGNVTTSATVSITDVLNGNAATTTGNVTGDGSVEYDGMYNGNSYAELLSNTNGKLTYVSWSYFEINNSSSLFPTTYAVTSIDSVRLSLFNAGGTSGNYGGNPGYIDLYLIQNNLGALPTSAGPLFYGTSAGQKPTSASQVAGNTGPSELGIGGNTSIGGNATFIGTAYFPNNYAGYNDFTFDNLPSGVSTEIAAALDSGTTLRFAMISHTGSAARVEWDGSLTDGNTPKVSIDAQTSSSAVEDFGLTSASSSFSKTAGSVTTDSINVSRIGHPD